MKRGLLIVSVIILFAACESDIKHSNEVIIKGEMPDISLEKVESIYSKNTEIQGKLYADVLYQYRNDDEPYSIFPKGIKFVSYDKNLKENRSLTADSAFYDQKKEFWEYHGNVVLINEKGDKLETQLLYADQKKELLFTDLPVHMQFDGNELDGDGGFKSNLNFTEWEFTDVRGFKDEAKGEAKQEINSGK